MLIIGPDHNPLLRIDFSYYEISGPDICFLICALRGEDEYEEFSDFILFIEMGSNREFSQEYLIYDTLSLIGTLGGTLGLFVGFSFYDFLTMITSFILKKVSSKVL